MSEFANKLIERAYLLFLILGLALLIIVAADNITIGGVNLRISAPIWQIIIGGLGLILVSIGIVLTWKDVFNRNAPNSLFADKESSDKVATKSATPISVTLAQPLLLTTIQKLEGQIAFADLISQAQDLMLAGVALGFAAQRHTSQLEEQIKKGCRLRFLLLDPNSRDIESIARSFSISSDQIRNDITITLHDLERLKDSAEGKKGSVEVRLLATEPAFSFVVVNPESSSDGYMTVGVRLHGYRSSTRPYFVLKPTDPWFSRFVDSCEKLWKDSMIWKPTKQKAGIIPYRLTANGELEVLLITARKFAGKWIFPVGAVEPDEDLQKAAIRECKEESGYVVKVERKDSWFLELEQEETIDQMKFFLGKVVQSTSQYETDRQRQWIPLSEITKHIAEDFLTMAQVIQTQLESESEHQA